MAQPIHAPNQENVGADDADSNVNRLREQLQPLKEDPGSEWRRSMPHKKFLALSRRRP